MLARIQLPVILRFKHLAVVLSMLLLVVVLGACGNGKDAVGDNQSNGLVAIQPIEISEHGDRDPMEINPPEKVTRVTLEIKNETSDEIGIGAFDFQAFDRSGKELEVYGYADGLGQSVKGDEEIEGNLYYAVETGNLARLVYNDPTLNETIEWIFEEEK